MLKQIALWAGRPGMGRVYGCGSSASIEVTVGTTTVGMDADRCIRFVEMAHLIGASSQASMARGQDHGHLLPLSHQSRPGIIS
jgi:hypothetical protein